MVPALIITASWKIPDISDSVNCLHPSGNGNHSKFSQFKLCKYCISFDRLEKSIYHVLHSVKKRVSVMKGCVSDGQANAAWLASLHIHSQLSGFRLSPTEIPPLIYEGLSSNPRSSAICHRSNWPEEGWKWEKNLRGRAFCLRGVDLIDSILNGALLFGFGGF